MEDAKITPNKEAQPGGSQGFPSVLTTEDLYAEMGRQVANGLNLEKIIKRLAGRMQVAANAAAEGKLNVEKAAELASSNKALSEQNLALDRELTTARTRATEAESKIAVAEKAVADAAEWAAKHLEIQNELDLAQEEIKKLKAPKRRKKTKKRK